MYADDLKLYRVVCSEDDAKGLQEDLDTVVAWSQHWGLSLNVSKCKSMSVSPKLKPKCISYTINGIILDKVLVHLDLVIYIDGKLIFL